jgi:hypothetical protein
VEDHVDKEPTTFSLNPEKLAHLFAVGSDVDKANEKMDTNQQKAMLLVNRLQEGLQVDPSTIDLLPEALGQHRDTIGKLTSESIGKLLKNTKTDITLLKKVKNYAKKLSRSANSEAEYETANVIYYAAIASSMIFHGRRITRFSYSDLGHSFDLLTELKWIPQDIFNLFKSASQQCKNKQ